MKIIRKVAELKEAVHQAKESGSVGFVPTMGALHEGHISLVKRCKNENDCCVVSVFVNPTQFNDKSDLEKYPRTEEADAALLGEAGCDIVFIPSVEEVYPENDDRVFEFGGLDNYMEGPSRPGHFNGVAQVVSRLFDLVTPCNAYFGEKDFQQVAIIKYMTKELNYPINIISCPIKRAENGLALSSRNMLLTEEQRNKASHIYAVLKSSTTKTNEMTISEMESWVKEQIEKCEGMSLEYYTISNATNLRPAVSWDEEGGVHGCITVRFGGVRLIDNIKY